MSTNHDQQNSFPQQAGMGTRIKGAFETVHGVGENIRGRTLRVIDDMTTSGPPNANSRHAALIDRGRIEAETGMAHMYGYADPNVYRDELARLSNNARNSHATGTGLRKDYVRAGEDDHRGPNGGVDGGVTRGAGGYDTDDKSDRPGGQDFVQQQHATDGNTQVGPSSDRSGGFSPNPAPQNTDPERMKRDFPPELPPRPQAQASDNNQRGQMYQ